jgi:hypothetical protein
VTLEHVQSQNRVIRPLFACQKTWHSFGIDSYETSFSINTVKKETFLNLLSQYHQLRHPFTNMASVAYMELHNIAPDLEHHGSTGTSILPFETTNLTAREQKAWDITAPSSPASFYKLPLEVLFHLLNFVTPRTLYKLRALSKDFKSQIETHLVWRCRMASTTSRFSTFQALGCPLIDFCIRPMMWAKGPSTAIIGANEARSGDNGMTVVDRPISFRLICDHYDSKAGLFVFRPEHAPVFEAPYHHSNRASKNNDAGVVRIDHDPTSDCQDMRLSHEKGWMILPASGSYWISVQSCWSDLRWETLVGFPVADSLICAQMPLVKGGRMDAQFQIGRAQEDRPEAVRIDIGRKKLRLVTLRVKPMVLFADTLNGTFY